jgi:hypothetical protein
VAGERTRLIGAHRSAKKRPKGNKPPGRRLRERNP